MLPKKRVEGIPTITLSSLAMKYVTGHISMRIRHIINRNKPGGYGQVMNYGAGVEGRDKRILMIYLTRPFYLGEDDPRVKDHQHTWQILEIAKIFNQLGYVVDAVNHSDSKLVPSVKYDVIFGVHPGFDRIARLVGPETLKIYYAVEMPWQFQNEAVRCRHRELAERRGLKLKHKRIVPKHDSLALADYVIYMGNDVTLSQYGKYTDTSNFRRIHNTISNRCLPDLSEKDFERSRKRFLFWGSSGLVLRGLDRVLEAFAELPECELYICGSLWAELRFCFGYRRELFGLPNVHTVGWVNIGSELFRRIFARCGYMIYPSGSEGCSGCVLTAMGYGLIPIISKNCAISTKEFGVTLKDCEVSTIRDTVREAANLSADECRRLAQKTLDEVTKEYTRENFVQKMAEAIKAFIKK